MLRLIYRQRRRLIFSAFFGTMGLILMMMQFAGPDMFFSDGWVGLVTLATMTVIIGTGAILAGAVIVVILPNWRACVELIGFMLFVYAVFDILWPGLQTVPYVGGFLNFIIFMFLYSMIYGELLDRFRIWVDQRDTRSFVSPKSAQELWDELVPGEAPIKAHWDSLLSSLEPDPEDPDAFDVQYTLGGSVFEHQTMTFLERDAPQYAKYHHVGDVDPKNRSLVEGTYAITITPRKKGGCKVTFESYRNLLLLRIALLLWFDDHTGDKADHLRARHLNKRDWSNAGRWRRKVAAFT